MELRVKWLYTGHTHTAHIHYSILYNSSIINWLDILQFRLVFFLNIKLQHEIVVGLQNSFVLICGRLRLRLCIEKLGDVISFSSKSDKDLNDLWIVLSEPMFMWNKSGDVTPATSNAGGYYNIQTTIEVWP